MSPPQPQPYPQTLIVGAGIVGSALAHHLSLSLSLPANSITILSPPSTPGSTAIAPGLVGQYNELAPLTRVAKESISTYATIPEAFSRVGGVEIAETLKGIQRLVERGKSARESGLRAEMVTAERVGEIAPDFCGGEKGKGLWFPDDAVAEPMRIVEFFLAGAKACGVNFLAEELLSIQACSSSGKYTITTPSRTLHPDTVILATGVWTPKILRGLGIELPIIPVGHPYAHGPERERRSTKQPFVRWPEKMVYARDHGDRDGFGSYDHLPVVCEPWESARGGDLDRAILEKAVTVFPSEKQRKSKFPYAEFNGIFAVTPDGMPLAGKLAENLYVAAAVWVTHASGTARLVADMVAGKELGEEDRKVLEAFDPKRFGGMEEEGLKKKALGTYNDIYNQTL